MLQALKHAWYRRRLRNPDFAFLLEDYDGDELVSIDWQGWVYDCDFNQMLGLPLRVAGRPRTHVSELVVSALAGNPIVVREHCFGCTAGQGSSCGGALA